MSEELLDDAELIETMLRTRKQSSSNEDFTDGTYLLTVSVSHTHTHTHTQIYIYI